MYNIKAMKVSLYRASILVVICVFLSGCAGSVMKYINPNANFTYIKKVAILPFNNFAGDRYAGEKVRANLTIEMMSRGVFEIAEQGEVSKVLELVLRAAGVTEGGVGNVDKETLKLIGERLGVQAVVLGTVYEYQGQGASSVVSIAARMIDTNSGIVLWTAKSDVSGTSVARKIIGIEEYDVTSLSRKAVKQVVDTLL